MNPAKTTLALVATLAVAGSIKSRRGSQSDQLSLFPPLPSTTPAKTPKIPPTKTGKPGRLRPFFSYFGSKWSLATKYPCPCPRTGGSRIIEPFAGSAAYSLLHYTKKVQLYDKDPIIIGVWQYLINATPDEIRKLPLIRHDQTVDDLKVSQEARWLIGFWLNKAKSSPAKRPGAWMRKGFQGYQFWGEKIRERIAQQVPYIKHWKAEVSDYDSIPNVKATWFVDPPYQDKGKFYRMGSSEIDFPKLGQWCRQLNGQVIVCENEGADWLPFRPFRTVKATTKRGGKAVQSVEVIWTKP